MISSKNAGRLAALAAASLWMVCSANGLCQQSSSQASGNSGNEFPVAQSEIAAKAAQKNEAPQNSKPQNPPANPSTQPKASSGANGSANQNKTSKSNPFPEAQSEAAAKADSGQSANGQTGASSAGYSSSNANLPPAELGQGKLTSHTKMDSFTRDQTQDGRVEGDISAADLYMKNGNYRGALLRYQDALQYDPQNDTALYGVAAAMCNENLTAEAMAHFKSYATNNPQGKYALKAEKMLAHPNKCKHNF